MKDHGQCGHEGRHAQRQRQFLHFKHRVFLKLCGRSEVLARRVKNDYQDTKLDTVFFDFTGYGQHPRVAQNKANAEKLVRFVRKKMRW